MKNDLSKILIEQVKSRDLRARQGKVISIQTGPPRTATVEIDGTNFSNIRISDHVDPVVNEGVWIVDLGAGSMLIIATNSSGQTRSQFLKAAGDTMTGSLTLTTLVHGGVTHLPYGSATSAPSSPATGWMYHDSSTGRIHVYNGSAWIEFAEVGAARSWTPTITQTGNVTFTNTRSRYVRNGNHVIAWFDLSVTGTGTGGAIIEIGGLPVAAASASSISGAGRITDASVTSYGVSYEGATTTSFRAMSGSNGSYVGASPNFALANLDGVRGHVIYEV